LKGAVVEHADVVVLGLGPGGEDVAVRLADAGLDVIGVEERLLGGECPGLYPFEDDDPSRRPAG